jgi:hypothetical protein
VPHNERWLLDGVAEVAALARPESPRTVSQRAFDDARARSLFYPGLPRAKRITEKLGMKWRDVLTVAHAWDDERGRLIDQRTRGPNAKWVTRGNAASALAVAAHRLGKESLTRDEYRRERAKMLADDAKRWMHGHQLRLPTAGQAVKAHGSWGDAVRAAGLQPPPNRGGCRGKAWIREDCVNAVARYLREAGRRPTRYGYGVWAAQQTQRQPSLGTIDEHGGWPVMLRDGSERLLGQELGISAT